MKRIFLIFGFSIGIGWGNTSAQVEIDATQYIIVSPQGALRSAVIASQPSGGVLLKVQPEYLKNFKDSHYDRIREQFGGVYPYTVVRADERFAIVNQVGDILILGEPEPKRIVLREGQGYTMVDAGGFPVIIPKQDAHTAVVEQWDKLTITPTLPPGVPADILRSRTLYSAKETIYSPNQKLASAGGSLLINGTRYRRFTLQMK